MKLSVPIYSLKRIAKSISRKEKIPLHAALDKVALNEGFRSWSLLASHATSVGLTTKILETISYGELILIGARPSHGKTLMGLELAARAAKIGKHAWFFTLEWNKTDVEESLKYLGERPIDTCDLFHFDGSDNISADYIIDRLAETVSGTVVVIDYLQLLDQRRTNPDLSSQVTRLRSFAQSRGIIIVFLSQVDRSYENSEKKMPTIDDIRLPNPIDLTLFDKLYLLHNDEIDQAQLA